MTPVPHLISEIRAFRPFLPAKDFETSLRFYKAIGFDAHPLGDTLAELSLGTHAFLLQSYYVKEWADNMMMHALVENVEAWWRHIDSLALATQFDVSAPARLGTSHGVSRWPMSGTRPGCCGTLRKRRNRKATSREALPSFGDAPQNFKLRRHRA